MELCETQAQTVDYGSASRCSVRGGILADSIGTGKTCVALALVDKLRCASPAVPSPTCQWNQPAGVKSASPPAGRVLAGVNGCPDLRKKGAPYVDEVGAVVYVM